MVTDKDADSAADVAREIGGQALRLDVFSEKDWEALAEVWPERDVVVNNAGITGFEEAMRAHDPEKASLGDWRAVHAVNLDGTFLGCRHPPARRAGA
jgi:NAD(P)-dependent dehydrogenase (short-subunit alcohol dehydrogenase family)